MKRRVGKSHDRTRHFGRDFWISFLTACVIVFFAEVAFDHLAGTGDLPGLSQSIFNITGAYEWMVGAARKPLERYTAVIAIDSENDPGVIGANEICGQREQVARMLCTIDSALPSVIVIDKFYGTKDCGKANVDLFNAFREVSQHVPLIVGRLVPGDGVETSSGQRYFLASTFKFPEGDGIKLAEGVVNIDPDSRKLPLRWRLYPDKDAAQAGTHLDWYPTLPLAAASGYDPNLLANHPRLASLINHHANPYISFLREAEFHPLPASQILAGGRPAPLSGNAQPGRFCPDEKPPKELAALSGKVVLIGEVDPIGDAHQSVVGKLPGYLMQANFIEALLDDRYFRAMPFLDYAYGFAILATLDFILIAFRERWALMISLFVVLILVSFGLLFLTVKLFGWYVNPLPVGLTAVVLRVSGPLFRRAEKATE